MVLGAFGSLTQGRKGQGLRAAREELRGTDGHASKMSQIDAYIEGQENV